MGCASAMPDSSRILETVPDIAAAAKSNIYNDLDNGETRVDD